MSGLVNGLPVASSRLTVFAPGTKMVFNQTAAPTGWTKVTGIDDDQALRVTTGTVGTGGSVPFETAFESKTPTISQPSATLGAVSGHQLAVSEITHHNHFFGYGAGTIYGESAGAGNSYSSSGDGEKTGWEGGTATHTHGFTQPTISQPSSSAIDLNVKFVDVIIATKD